MPWGNEYHYDTIWMTVDAVDAKLWDPDLEVFINHENHCISHLYIYIYIHKNHAYATWAGKASINTRSSSYDNAYCEKCVSCCIFVCVCNVISRDSVSIVVLCITHMCSVHGASNSGCFEHVRRI